MYTNCISSDRQMYLLGCLYPRLGTSVIELTHYALLCMDLECKMFFMIYKCNLQGFFNYRVTDAETFIKRNIPYNVHG